VNLLIRSYHDADLEACRELWIQLTHWHRHIYNAPSIGGDDPGQHFDKHLAKVGREKLWVAEQEGEIVGLIGLQPGYDEGSVEVEPLVVAHEARGTGVGRALIEHLVAAVKEMGLRDLNVHVVGRNAEAIRFYHDVGFNVIGHFELLYDTSPHSEQPWQDGETVAGRRFRV
jgi:ribosomal protein S18 acetylase RimI-like enzyme